MKHFFFVVLLFLIQTSLFSQENQFIEEANQLLEDCITNNQSVGITGGFSIKGMHQWEQAKGFENLATESAFTPQTKTRIASITKPMTAIAIMQLLEQGKLQLDIPIQTYIPDYPQHPEGDITIRHLLQHGSGIPAYAKKKEQENMKQYDNLEDALEIFKDRSLLASPGETFHYTSYGYDVLGLIIEKVSDMNYEQYLKKYIWEPAGMTHTGIENEMMDLAELSEVYHVNHKGKIKKVKRTNLSDRIPAGGVYSTCEDMLNFGDAILENKLITQESLDMMIQDSQLKNEGNPYGLGWYLYGENPKYGFVFGHNGTQTGCSSFLMLLPEEKLSIVVLSNTSGAMQAVSNVTISLFDIAYKAKT